VIYVDTSALVKVLRSDEPQANEVREYIADAGALVSSRLLAIEMHMVAARFGIDAHVIERVLDRVDQVAIDEDVIQAAIRLPALRSLDAIHLGTAAYLGDELFGLLTFDHRMRAGAERVGVPVVSLS